MGVWEFLIVLCMMALAIPIVGCIAWMVVASSRARHGGGRASGEEARLVQDLNRGFSQLEKRIESLETILLDRVEKGKEREEKTS
ncbi:hypothetical protein HS125_15635 [bacterium]|nr:hypothetical protein [bacterium]